MMAGSHDTPSPAWLSPDHLPLTLSGDTDGTEPIHFVAVTASDRAAFAAAEHDGVSIIA
jgi:hypothetical protein